MKNQAKAKGTQRLLDSENGKNIVLESVIKSAAGKEQRHRVVLSPSQVSALRNTAKKDANTFNKEVTKSITSKLCLDSQSEKQGKCFNAHPKMVQARVANLIGVGNLPSLMKTNSYLRTKKAPAKKVVVKK